MSWGIAIKNIYNITLKKRRWRKENAHNSTHMVNDFDIDLVKVGRYTYGGINVSAYNKSSKLTIGNFCSIAPKVAFMLSSDHFINHISSFPFKVKVLEENLEGVSKGDIIVDDDVWIGYDSTILSGVHIGQGAVIAAGAVVAKNVPPYAIVGGVPAKVIKYRFDQKIIDKLVMVDYNKITKEQIQEHIDDLYKNITSLEQLDWLPQKDIDF